MGSLSALQRKRLAKEARKLAMECVEGTAPVLGANSGFGWDGAPICALGHIYGRAFGRCGGLVYAESGWVIGEHLVWEANDEATDPDRQSAVVFPLLALADALEEAQP